MSTATGRPRRALAVTLAAIVVLCAGPIPARARSELQRHRAEGRHVAHALRLARRTHRHVTAGSLSTIRRSRRFLAIGPGRGLVANPARWTRVRAQLRYDLRLARRRLRRIDRATARRVGTLVTRRTAIERWIGMWGLFERCPVHRPRAVADDFGAIVRLPGVPVHRHQGNDIAAPTGTPIVAPFDGNAVPSPNGLGGRAVTVYGAHGYIYNAHLSAYGRLGGVRAGEVIGYVGSTGDATAPHDHVEWHPDGGGAVDPHAYLAASCG
jgi:hypothetical protein